MQIQEALEVGLSAQRIYQDLVAEQKFAGSYESVKRFVRRLGEVTPLPFRRMECEPAQQVQVDFGKGARVLVEGKRKRPHLFRIVLSHSRKAYSEVGWRQTTENFIRCLENAFRHFGGVTQTVVPDNLKAAVIKADWFDPELNPKIVSFAERTARASCGSTFRPDAFTRPACKTGLRSCWRRRRCCSSACRRRASAAGWGC